MRCRKLKCIVLFVLLSGNCPFSPAQSHPAKLRVLDGTVTGFFEGARQIHINIESGGNKYDFPLATPGDGSQDPEIVGDVRTVGARVRVHYTSLGRYNNWGYNGTAVRISNIGGADNFSQLPKNSLTEQSWNSFFAAVRSAAQKRDRRALTALMSKDFQYNCCDSYDENQNGDLRDEAFRLWMKRGVRGWQALARVLAKGAVASKAYSIDGEIPAPRKIAPPAAAGGSYTDWIALFEFRGGRWYFTGFLVPEADHGR